MKEKLDNFITNLTQNSLGDLDLGKFITWKYLTDATPAKQFFYEQWIYVLVLINWFFSIVFFKVVGNKLFKANPKKRLVKRVSFLWFGNTVFLLLYNLLRSEGVKFLSMRLFMLVIFIFYILIVVYFIFYWLLKIPAEMSSYKEAKIRDKYKNR